MAQFVVVIRAALILRCFNREASLRISSLREIAVIQPETGKVSLTSCAR